MDTETLKIILKLHEENILLHRAISDILLKLKTGSTKTTSIYDIGLIDFLIDSVQDIITQTESMRSEI